MFHPVSCLRTPFEISFSPCQVVVDNVIQGITKSVLLSGHCIKEPIAICSLMTVEIRITLLA